MLFETLESLLIQVSRTAAMSAVIC